MKQFSIALLSLFACAAIAADAPATFKVSDFTFKRPEKWEWIENTSPMRKAQLKITDANEKNPAEVVFYHFGVGDGGGVQANVDRWFRQFQSTDKNVAKSEKTKIGKHDVTFVQTEGTFMSGMPGGPASPQPNSALRGAIIESENGSVFVKMTGPASLVKSSEGDFRKMIESALK